MEVFYEVGYEVRYNEGCEVKYEMKKWSIL